MDKFLSAIEPFQGSLRWILVEKSYIVWRLATGLNIELLHLYAEKGRGLELLTKMLHELKPNPPYETVFGFTRTCNTHAQHFYTKAGFDLSPVKGVYADGDAVLFSQTFSKLWERHCEQNNS